MASFRAAERDETAAQFGKEHADAAVARMKTRLDKLKAMQVSCVCEACGFGPSNTYCARLSCCIRRLQHDIVSAAGGRQDCGIL